MQSDHDPCVFVLRNNSGFIYLVLYVDDFRIVWDSDLRAWGGSIKATLQEKFNLTMGENNPISSTFLGANRFCPNSKYRHISCQTYIDEMEKRYLPDENVRTASKRFPSLYSYQPAHDGVFIKDVESALIKRIHPSPQMI